MTQQQQPPIEITTARATVGPVIGEVTSTTARILLEVDETIDVVCKLQSENSTQCFYQKKQFIKNRPGVFMFRDLPPATRFYVSFPSLVNYDSREGKFLEYLRILCCYCFRKFCVVAFVIGTFKTHAVPLTKMTIVTLSCNSINEPEEPIVWNGMLHFIFFKFKRVKKQFQ
jgi:hypothetical protein